MRASLGWLTSQPSTSRLRYLLLNQLQRIQQEGYEVFGISADGPDVTVVEAAGIPHFAVPMTRRIHTAGGPA